MKLITKVLTGDDYKDLSYEFILRGFKSLYHIIIGNYPGQAMMFKDVGFSLFADVFESFPIESSIFMADI